MTALYNDNDPKVAAWLREIISRGLLPSGYVYEHSIDEIPPSGCAPTSHFFAGIGGWPLALRLAGWPDTRPVWTGSCPCQPFSVAGKRLGAADKRHLWPAWFRLIRECRPVTIFGEQVASAIGHGWLDGVFTDLEGEGYTCGAVVLGAHSVGTPHIRQRVFWMAHAKQRPAERPGLEMASATAEGQGTMGKQRLRDDVVNGGNSGWLGDPDPAQPQGRLVGGNGAGEQTAGAAGMGFWSSYDLIPCADGKSRRVEPGSFPLAHGVPARVVRLRGYGNAIVPQLAAAFVRCVMEASRGSFYD